MYYKGCIYRHYIIIDNKEISYIGLTTQDDVNNRWQDGWGYIDNDRNRKTKFAEAIVQYGWNNFNHEIVVEVSCQTKEELDNLLDELEKKYIEIYDSFYNGFNSTNGGKKGYETKNSKKVICLTTGEIFDSINKAAKHYNVDTSTIKRNINHKYKYAGRHPITKECLVWSYVDNLDEQDIKTYKYICYNDQEKYVTFREMSEVYGFSIGQIRKCCIGEKECLYTPDGEKYFFGKI